VAFLPEESSDSLKEVAEFFKSQIQQDADVVLGLAGFLKLPFLKIDSLNA